MWPITASPHAPGLAAAPAPAPAPPALDAPMSTRGPRGGSAVGSDVGGAKMDEVPRWGKSSSSAPKHEQWDYIILVFCLYRFTSFSTHGEFRV